MSRSLVFSEQFTESAPSVADALREHREDRSALLASLTTSLQSEPRVKAVWFHGSFGRGEADDFSDLDLWVSVANEHATDASIFLSGHAALAANFIGAKRTFQIAPPSGGFFTTRQEGRRAYLGIDWSWQPQNALTLPADVKLLFKRMEPETSSPVLSLPTVVFGKDISESPIEGGLFFAWLMVGVAAKWLVRDLQSDMALMLYPRPALEYAIAELGRHDLLPIDWSVPDAPLDKIARLRGLAQIVARTVEAARMEGYSFPPRYLPCLFQYLDLVESVLGNRV